VVARRCEIASPLLALCRRARAKPIAADGDVRVILGPAQDEPPTIAVSG
jgi:hypothetical protein